MAQLEMYPPIINSPTTQLANAIDSTTTSIEVVDGARLPDAPNICTIGRGENPETILYTSKVGNVISGITRGFQGNAQNWQAGTQVARLFTAYDLESLQQNHKTHLAESVSYVTSLTRDLSIKGIQQITNIGFKPKSIWIYATIEGASALSKESVGVVGQNGQRVKVALNNNTRYFEVGRAIKIYGATDADATIGAVTATADGFNIEWSHAGAGATGLCIITFLAQGHGGA